ncbi:MAG: HAD family hydrolase [Gammaproteobacteria bacterium]|jgi:HAD superfamily hydrolase (TIGR01509 family)|nr:HAD family hydrolase [Gammaproteobacteria bacterium]
MIPLQALIFDVDGTLADTEADGHRPAFNLAFQEAGLGWEWNRELYGELLAVTGGKERIRYYLERWRPGELERPALADFIAGLHRRKTAYYLELLRAGAIPLRPGVRRLLEEARAAGLRLAVATTTTPENVITLLECAGGAEWPGWFEVIAAGDVVPAKKPAPDIFHYALDGLGLPAAACVAIEDSAHGVRAALGADLRALLVTVSTYTGEEDFRGAARVVASLGEPGESAVAGAGEGDCIDLAALVALHRGIYCPE